MQPLSLSHLNDGDFIVFDDGTCEVKVNSSSPHLFGGIQPRTTFSHKIPTSELQVPTHIIQGHKVYIIRNNHD